MQARPRAGLFYGYSIATELHEFSVARNSCKLQSMKNVTITVEDSVLEWARVEAARRGTSVSRMLGDFMAELQRREDSYERAYLAWRTDERGWKAQSQDASESVARSAIASRTSASNDLKNGFEA